MRTLRKLQRDFVKADLDALETLVSQLEPDDVMARFTLESRLDELRQSAAEIETGALDTSASAALFFGGAPVVGNRGIESIFGSNAVGKFQDLVSKVLAHKTSGLGQRGVVPNKGSSTLHITGIVRGSFGFLLEEVRPQEQLIDTELKAAVDDTTALLDAFGEPSEERFEEAVAETDERVLGTARDFFELLKQADATMRIVNGDQDRSFNRVAVSRASERAKSTQIKETEEHLPGKLSGTLPNFFQFDFEAESGETLRGRISRKFTTEDLMKLNRDMVGKHAIATFAVTRVTRNGSLAKTSYVLQHLENYARPIETS